MKPALSEVGEYLVTETMFRFDQESDPTGKKWIQSKAAREEGRKTLTFRGFLRQAVTYNVTENSLEYGVGNFPAYAKIHQYGGKYGHAVLPARPYLGVNENDEKEIEATLFRYAFKQYERSLTGSLQMATIVTTFLADSIRSHVLGMQSMPVPTTTKVALYTVGTGIIDNVPTGEVVDPNYQRMVVTFNEEGLSDPFHFEGMSVEVNLADFSSSVSITTPSDKEVCVAD